MTLTGDQTDEDGNCQETLELWMRDPVACVQELLGNPAFKKELHYRPRRTFRDRQRQKQVYDETWTGDWWWKTQVSIRNLRLEKK